MPRPAFKRRKLNATSRTQRVSPVISPRIVRQELETTLANKAIGTRPAESDDSDELVHKARNLRDRNNFVRPREEIYASGGVAKGDVPGSHPSRKRKSSAAQPNQGKKLQTASKNAQSGSVQMKSADQSKCNLPAKSQPKPLARSALPSPLPFATRSIQAAPTPLRGTPTTGASILASLKPRRRLPSILKPADGQDSSSLNIDDEAEFLPDDESTPLNLTKGAAIASTPSSSLSQQSNLRVCSATSLVNSKSKLSTGQPNQISAEPVVQVPASSPAEPELPVMPSVLTKGSKRKSRSQNDDAILALPESSSSPEPNSTRFKEPSPTKNRRRQKEEQPRALSTEALQAMMPKRPKVRQQRRKAAHEFEIPLDSDDVTPGAVSDNDEQSFIPPGRGKKARRRETVKPNNARKKTEAKARNQRATSTLSPTKNTRLRDRVTKSPSQQPRHSSTVTKPNSKSYTSRHPRPERRGSAVDKENRRGALSADFSDASDGAEARGENGGDEAVEGPSAGLLAIKAKFAEIDDWDMEFEEVSDVTSSDPMMR